MRHVAHPSANTPKMLEDHLSLPCIRMNISKANNTLKHCWQRLNKAKKLIEQKVSEMITKPAEEAGHTEWVFQENQRTVINDGKRIDDKSTIYCRRPYVVVEQKNSELKKQTLDITWSLRGAIAAERGVFGGGSTCNIRLSWMRAQHGKHLHHTSKAATNPLEK